VAAQDAPALNMPGWLAGALARDWGPDAARAAAEAHLSPAPHDLTPAAPGDAAALADELEARLLPTGTVRLTTRPQLSALPGYAAGAWWVQDAAAALPARLVPRGAGRVLDLCAAPGGKTMQLAAAGARVTALDLSEPRMGRLRENLRRTGLQAETVTADALEWRPEAPYDAILLDAPCTATGTIRRHPDLPHRTDGSALAELTALQARLLDRAWGWLAPGGVLVFCTCSLLRAEGEAQADAFLARTPDAALASIALEDAIPPDFVAEGRLRTRPDGWPELGGLDGFFAARFVRK
jgi:16S rRNA (cytosine967-C5)-methyltransferase